MKKKAKNKIMFKGNDRWKDEYKRVDNEAIIGLLPLKPKRKVKKNVSTTKELEEKTKLSIKKGSKRIQAIRKYVQDSMKIGKAKERWEAECKRVQDFVNETPKKKKNRFNWKFVDEVKKSLS